MNIIVVSPHLDDAVLSIGATIHRLSREGHSVKVVTVFAGDPLDRTAPSYWDSARGLATYGEVSQVRRFEDEKALTVVKATPHWLPFSDSSYILARDPERIWSALAPHMDGADAVALPGWPLAHFDHRYVTQPVLQRLGADAPSVFYAEQPYASIPFERLKACLRGRTVAPLRHDYGDITWTAHRIHPDDLRAKRAAQAAYSDEIARLGLKSWLKRALLGGGTGSEWFGIGKQSSIPAGLGLT